MGGVPVLDIKPKGWKNSRKLLVYTHGGAYALYSAKSRLMSAVPMANDNRAAGRVSRLYLDSTRQVKCGHQPGCCRHPGVARRRAYIEQHGRLRRVCRGGLAAGAVLKMRDKGLGVPAAVVLWSPWSDITETGDSYTTLKDADPLLFYPSNLKHCADVYAAPADQKHPYVSPVYGDYSKGFPPTLIEAGTKEIFLSNAVRYYQALDNVSIPVKLDLYEGMWHIFLVFNQDLPKSKLARNKVRAFLSQHVGK